MRQILEPSVAVHRFTACPSFWHIVTLYPLLIAQCSRTTSVQISMQRVRRSLTSCDFKIKYLNQNSGLLFCMLGSYLSTAQKWPQDSGWAVSLCAIKCWSITDKNNALKLCLQKQSRRFSKFLAGLCIHNIWAKKYVLISHYFLITLHGRDFCCWESVAA